MAFIPTLVDNLAPDYAGTKKIERWTATAEAADAGTGTIQARHLRTIEDVEITVFNGTGPTTYSFSGRSLVFQLPGTTTATLYRIELQGR